jgi:hypothetical protein
MVAQTRAWMERAGTIDTLGRYEARLSRQLLKYQQEFERLQTVRKEQERIDSHRSRNEIKRDQFDPASFGLPAGSYRILSHLPPPKDLQGPQSGAADDLSCGAEDLDQGRSGMVSLVQDKVVPSAAPVASVLPQNPENMAA